MSKPTYSDLEKRVKELEKAGAGSKEMETKFYTLFESSSDAIMMLDDNGFFDCNQQTLLLFGCGSREKFCSLHPSDLSPLEQADGRESITAANERIETAMREGGCRFDWIYKRHDTGEVFPAEVLLSPMKLGGKKVLQASVRDVTERKKAEEELIKSKNLLSSVLESTDDVIIFSLDEQFRYTAFNKAHVNTMKLVYGSTIELGRCIFDFMSVPEDIEKARGFYERVFRGERFTVEEIFGERENRFWFELNYNPIFDSSEKVVGLTLYTTTITDRKKAELALRESDERFHIVTQTAEIGITETDLITGKVHWDDTCYRIHGYQTGTVPTLDRYLEDIVHPDEKNDALVKYKEALDSDRKRFHTEYKILRPDGTVRWIDEDHTIIRNHEGKAISTYSSKMDITERKQAEDEKARLLHEVGERVKELDCLYSLSKLIEKPGISLEEIFQGTVNLIPDSWQYPDITCAKINIDGREYQTNKCKCPETEWKQKSDIILNGEKVGALTVRYLEEKPELDDGPFLKEERNLIDSLTERLGRVIERHKAENELKETQILLKSSIESPKDMIILSLDREYRYLYFNKIHSEAMKHVFGTQPKIGDCIFDHMINEDDIKTVKSHYDRAMSGEGHVAIEEYGEDQTRYYYEIRYSPLYDNNNEIIGVTSFAQNIAERKRTEELLRESESRHSEAQSVAKIGHWELDPETEKTTWSDEIFHIFGLNPDIDSPSFTDHKDIIFPDDWPVLQKSVYSTAKDGTPFDVEFRLVKQDQTIRWMHALGHAARNKDGQICRLFGTAQDITDRKIAEEDLINSESTLKSIFDSSTLMMGIAEVHDNDIFYIVDNKSTSNFFGYSLEKMKNQYSSSLGTPQEHINFWIKQYKESEKTNKPVDFIYTHHTPSGQKTLSATVSFIAKVDRKSRFSYIIEDITERKILEEQLQIRQRMDSLGTLAGGIAHDFNNILTGIIGNLSILEDVSQDFSLFQKNILSKSIKSSERAADLIGRFQTLAKTSLSVRHTVDLYKITEEVFGLLRNTTNKLIEKKTKFKKGKFFVTANSTELNQVLLNLGTNAAYAIESRGVKPGDHITIKAEDYIAGIGDKTGLSEGNYVHLIFQDNGTGMSDNVKRKAFDPLFTTKGLSSQKGQGLGLAMVYNIITRIYKGHIYIESKEGKGTTFHIYLPKAEPVQKIKDEKRPDIKGGSETILVAEDEEIVYDYVNTILGKYGYNVIIATDGAKATKLYKKNKDKISAVIIDLTMPGMSGQMFFEKMLKIDPDVKVIIMSGHDEEYTHAGILALAKGNIKKPFKMEVFAETVRKVLDS